MLQGHGPGGAIGAPESDIAPSRSAAGEDPFGHMPGSVIDGRYYTFDADKRAAWDAP